MRSFQPLNPFKEAVRLSAEHCSEDEDFHGKYQVEIYYKNYCMEMVVDEIRKKQSTGVLMYQLM